MQHILPTVLLGFTCILLVGLAAPAAAADPAVLQQEFIYDGGPYPQIHASTLAETPAGLVAAWFGGTHEKHPDVGIWVSRQVAGRWTPSVEVANGIQYTQSDGTLVRHPTWNPVLFQPKGGPLLLFYKVGPTPQSWWGMLSTSSDYGQSWSPGRRLPEGILGPIKNKPLQLDDGSLLCPSSEETPVEGGTQRWTIHFERTVDFGETWQRTEPLHDGVAIQAIQPSLLRLADGSLLALGRSRQDRIFEIRSRDAGKTWDSIKLGTLPNNNSGTDAVTLRDGTHMIVYNHIGGTPGHWGGKRTPLNVAISSDGVTWQAALVLEDEPGEYSYPAIIQTSDDKVHITYTWNRKKVKHVVIDPRRINPQPLPQGQWPQSAD